MSNLTFLAVTICGALAPVIACAAAAVIHMVPAFSAIVSALQ